MDVTGALLEIRTRQHPDQGDRKLVGPEPVAEATQFPGTSDPA
jgi:hypothetical protein